MPVRVFLPWALTFTAIYTVSSNFVTKIAQGRLTVQHKKFVRGVHEWYMKAAVRYELFFCLAVSVSGLH